MGVSNQRESVLAWERATGYQFLVYVDRSTDGEPIENFAVQAFQAKPLQDEAKGGVDGKVKIRRPDGFGIAVGQRRRFAGHV